MALIKKKCWPEWYKKFINGERTFELRLADFNLITGDFLLFEEYDPKKEKYTGRKARFLCQKVERSARNPVQFYKMKDVKKYGFYIIKLKRK